MKFLVVICVVLMIALLGGAGRTAQNRLPGFFGHVVATGILFLLFGAFLGPSGLNFITPEYLVQLGPVVVLALSWIGFVFGFNLQWRWLKKFSLSLFLLALIEALATFGLVGIGLLAVLPRLLGDGASGSITPAVAVLAAAAAGTAPASLFSLEARRLSPKSTLRVVRFLAVLDDVPGLIALGVLFAFAHKYSSSPAALLSGWQWMLLSIALGVVFGLLATTLTPAYKEEQKLGLVILGILSLSGGICAYLHLSPLFVNAVAGVTFSNLSAGRERVFSHIAPREHAIYVFFLLLVGCLWLSSLSYVVVALVYVVLRLLGKLAGAAFGTIALRPLGADPRLGLTLLPQGGLAVAMAVDYHRTYGSPALPGVLTVVMIAVVVNELVGRSVALRELRRRGEI